VSRRGGGPVSRIRLAALAALVAVCPAGAAAQQAQVQDTTPQPPIFRTRVTMVPIDVRVVDSRGRPITDLTADDFTIAENGVRQQIRHFSTVTLTAEERDPARPTFEQLMGDHDGDVFAPQNRRVFLILLGRGRVLGPVKEVEGLIEFVRERLMPQDLVAVQAYNRATAFTSHHEETARLLEQFRERNPYIERDLENWFSGLRVRHVDPGEIPPHVQARIDDLFDSMPLLAARTATPAVMADVEGIQQDIRRTADELQRAEELAGRPGGLPDSVAAATAGRLELSLDDYAQQQADLHQDVMGVFAGINYLRRLEGEKHLVFVTSKGVSLPRQEQNQNLAAVAADGRVALHIVYTAGPVMPPPGPLIRAVATPVMAFRQMFGVKDLRLMADITGGHMSVFKTGIEALDRIDRATRFHYLLGYDSSNARLDGKFRDVSVRVNRRGATVLHRRGYIATEQLVPMDRRAFLTATRMAAAGASDREITDIAVTVKDTSVEGTGDARRLVLQLHVRAPQMRLVEGEDGRREGKLEVAIHVADSRQRLIGEAHQTIDLRLAPETVARFLADGTPFASRIPVIADPVYLRVVVYDYSADMLGTATMKLR
jgi:VWFA-related protein